MFRATTGAICLLLSQGCAMLDFGDGCPADGRDYSFDRKTTYIPAAQAPVGVATLGNTIGHGPVSLVKVDKPRECRP